MRTVKEISDLTGISVRTLHYYDEIGLLKPTEKSDAGYRLYDDKALETLQQVLFFREFDIPLKEIKAVMENPVLERNQILQMQRKMLVAKKERMERLINSIDDILKGDNKMDFAIFSKTEVEEMFQTMIEHMLIVQDQVWNRVTVNRAEKKATRYYMDEFHLLLKEEQTAAYSVEIWKRFRKWGGIPTAITQNVKDLLSSREVENIFENSDFVLMLNQAQGDRAILAKQLNISPQQMKYVTHTEAGEGLIFYGNVVLPFIDRFPTDTELYCLLTTKPEEVSKP